MSSTARDYGKGNPLTHVIWSSGRIVPADQPQSCPGKNMPAVICDFDDTVCVENVAELLLEHFGEDASWRELRRQSRERTITLKEYQERAFRGIGASRDAMQALVKARATLRPHFKELWRYCQAQGIPLAIVTVGLDFYVDAVLERDGLEEVPRYTVKTSFTPQGISYEYPYSWDGSGASPMDVCSQWGTCKCSVLAEYRKRGYSIFYVGDGRSDFCPASMADQVFARDQLAHLARENHVPYTEFQDFRDVIQVLESVLPLLVGGS